MKNTTLSWLIFGLFCLAWVGIWGAWLPSQSASISQHAVDFAEWSTRLIDVRSGDLRFMPDILRISLALTVGGVALSAQVISSRFIRWLIRCVTLVPAIVMLPPYPDVFQLFFSDAYGLRFTACAVAFVLVTSTFLVDRLRPQYQQLLAGLVGVAALGTSLWAYVLLRRPFTIHLNTDFGPGWGAILFTLSLVAALALLVTASLQNKKLTQPAATSEPLKQTS